MPQRHIIPISGKDSLATALYQTTRYPNPPYEFFFNDTGAELPEVYKWLEQIESIKGWKIQRISQPLIPLIEKYGGFLPSPKKRYCTTNAKIRPTERFLKKQKTIVYYGLRADETRTGYVPLGNSSIEPAYPLQEGGIDLQGVWHILKAQNLLPPAFFWKRLAEAVEARGGNLSFLSEWEKYFWLAGRSRANCFFCFYQRQYEWVWLLETHPELYWQSASLEKDDYTLNPAFSLKKFAQDEKRKQRAFDRRVEDVFRAISNKRQLSLFDFDSEIAVTSCGLLCGK